MTRATNPANSGLLVENQEISVRARMRGGAGRTRTSNQAVIEPAPDAGRYPTAMMAASLCRDLRRQETV